MMPLNLLTNIYWDSGVVVERPTHRVGKQSNHFEDSKKSVQRRLLAVGFNRHHSVLNK